MWTKSEVIKKFEVINSAAVIFNNLELKIVLTDCMQPRVMLERITWPLYKEDDTSGSELNSDSSQEDVVFRGFDSSEDSNFNQNDTKPRPAVDDANSTSLNQNVVSKLASNEQFQLYIKQVQARLAIKKEESLSDGAYAFGFDENGVEENSDIYHSIAENDGMSKAENLSDGAYEFGSNENDVEEGDDDDDYRPFIEIDDNVVSSGKMLTATDSEFYSDAGSCAMYEETVEYMVEEMEAEGKQR